MKRLPSRVVAVIALVGAAAAGGSLPILARALDTSSTVSGVVDLNEGSGVVGLDAAGNRLLLEGNESVDLPAAGGSKVRRSPDVQLVRGAAKAFGKDKVAKHSTRLDLSALEIDDVEEVAWDGSRGAAFLVASHSRTKTGKVKPERYKLARLMFAGDRVANSAATDALLPALRKSFPFLASAMDTAEPDVGGPNGALNIEGAVFVPAGSPGARAGGGFLLLGLRSPTSANGDALALRLRHPHALFDRLRGAGAAAPDFNPAPVRLPLNGQGIRGMAYDPERKGCWIVSGRSAHDGKTDPWGLWFWDLKQGDRPRKATVPADINLATPEGICCLLLRGKPGLLLVEDANTPTSRYALFPKLPPP